MGWLQKWSEENPDGQELACRDTDKWCLALWFTPTRIGLEVSVEREYGGFGWPEALVLNVNVGPLFFVARRTWKSKP